MIWDYIKDKLLSVDLVNRHYELLFDGYNNLYECFYKIYLEQKDELFVVYDNEDFTYGNIYILIETICSNLERRYGNNKPLNVGVLLDSSVYYICFLLAINKMGWISILYPTKYGSYEINDLIKIIDIDLLISETNFNDVIDGLDKDVECLNFKDCLLECDLCVIKATSERYYNFLDIETLEKDAIIMFTSGTTSHSKASVIKNFNLVHAIETYKNIFQLSKYDSTLLATPIYNITGIVGIFSTIMSCGGIIYLHSKFNIDNLVDGLKRFKITYFHSSSVVLKKIIESSKSKVFNNIRLVACGSSMLSSNDINRIKAIMPNASIRVIYGLTESSSPGAIFPVDIYKHNKINSSGIAIPGLEIKIIDDYFRDVGFNTIGEIGIKGTNVITRYIPDNNELINEDGLLRTGDLGYVDNDGFLFVKDRKKDIINRGGEKIFGLEVEECLYNIKQVKEVAVVAKHDEIYGEVPVAVISTYDNEKININMIVNFLETRLAKYKIPVDYYFIKELKKTKNNKIDKKALRDLVNCVSDNIK
ncbi:long-chain fatty acid--CoA ligase [Lonepinella koalarum]|uniref:Fatty-acyl-CoA synthase/long-chain acyl-CoA synthetase n=1 Tax=Lonepinella koalarum TaxID=53417 RepID=A0A4R1KX72_9PAST|nr:fatty acid--CoA ligase family protein [Lonepinella koalarum]MDH2927733.1 hypothetical protein [Lonepinella koalarum]TCK69928.1 fatty-acyl-CoA synthase/long-chain acyl-CoA synthetase [Lonepinella koalarum]TFJ90468.1 hypothetical protein E0709_03790 [Lonepinella koalarum]TYG35164.1 long-chain fatty acid--CoA ligase [Lonepinella koalarum]